MESSLVRTGFRRALATCHAPSRRRAAARFYATEANEPIRAAPPITFTSDNNQFSRASNRPPPSRTGGSNYGSRYNGGPREDNPLLSRIRVLPASPSYFTATPRYTDDLLALSTLLRRYQLLPQLAPGLAPRVAWKTYQQYKSEIDEPVQITRYSRLLEIVKRLNYIHPDLMPPDVPIALERFKRTLQPFLNKPTPILIDSYGRAKAAGRRKTSSAQVYVVEGDGECMINGKSLTEYFGRLHDRESAVWALRATQRLDRYNVWGVAQGGGTTGQAEAVMLAVARGLMAHEPELRPALRKAGVLTRDPRKVERKKPGKLKARKMPAWVKR